MNKRKKPKPSQKPRSFKFSMRDWYEGKAPVLQFGLKFCALIGLFYVLSLAPVFQRGLAASVAADARFSGAILNRLGEQTHVSGNTIWSARYAMSVVEACSAFEYTWFFCAAVLAFPAPFARKIPGVVVGVALLLALNLVRIVSLFLIGVHLPGFFEAAHEEVWGVVLVVAELFLCVAWIGWATPREPVDAHVAA